MLSVFFYIVAEQCVQVHRISLFTKLQRTGLMVYFFLISGFSSQPDHLKPFTLRVTLTEIQALVAVTMQ